MGRARRPPVVALAAIVALPAVPLAVITVWATRSDDGAVEAVTSASSEATTSPAVPVLSLRRAPDALSLAWSAAALARALDPLVDRLEEPSCLMVDVGDTVVRSVRAARPVVPASNMKLLTTGVLLDLVGPDWRYVTRVVGDMDANGVVDGDLALVGSGDPMLATAWYPESYAASRFPQRPATSLEELADAVVAAGVTAVRGDVVGDESRYDDEYFRPGWDASLRVSEAGPYSALVVDDGRLEAGGVAEVPALAAAQVFRELLVARGIEVDGSATVGIARPAAPDIASVSSAPMSQIVRHVLHTSDNSAAEMMLKEIAVISGRPGTADDGIATLLDELSSSGVPIEGVAPLDGSGLDIGGQATCEAMVDVLVGAGPSSALVEAMPLLGVDGTLAGVLADHPLAGRLHAKTGSLGQSADRLDVRALSGVLSADTAPAVSFSLLLNGGTVREEATYLPLWTELADALAAYPNAPSSAELAPPVSP